MPSTIALPVVPTLTTKEFHKSVFSLEPKIAVFDCDGTLWSGDAGSSFMRWTMDNGLLNAERTSQLNERYEGYKRGEVSELAICGEMVQIYHGLPVDTLRLAAAAFFSENIEENIFAEMQSLVNRLLEHGTEIWAVSSTCDWVIEEGVKRFGISTKRVLAARVECVNGLTTDKLLDVPTDEGKVAALKGAGITAPDAVFGNSIHDAAMLSIARKAFPVNPSVDLMHRSVAEGWPVFFPSSVSR